MDYCYVRVWVYYIRIYSSRYTAQWNILLFNGEDLSFFYLINNIKKKKCLFYDNAYLTDYLLFVCLLLTVYYFEHV